MTARRTLMVAALSAMLAVPPTPAFAAARATSGEAVAMARRAVTFLQLKGRDEAFRHFNDPSGGFVDRDLYIAVVDAAGYMLAHGGNRRLIGKSLMDIKDADGKAFIRALLDTGNKQSNGWVDYKWPNPATGQIESKSSYVEKTGSVYVICGIYKPS